MSKRVSNRKYTSKSCSQCKKSFTPTDRRQIYCCHQCRIDFNNDKRFRVEAEALLIKKGLLKNEKTLKYAYELLKLNLTKEIAIDYLIYSGFQPGIFSGQSINREIGTKVLWSLGYGIEGIQSNNKVVKILKK